MIHSHPVEPRRSEVSARRRRQWRRVVGVCIWAGALTILAQRLEPRPSRDAGVQRVSLAAGATPPAAAAGLVNRWQARLL